MKGRRFSAGALLVLVACAPTAHEEPDGAPATPAVASDIAADERIAELLFPCAEAGYFGADTSELLPAFLHKLEHGQRDPLALARAELGRMGARALPGLAAITDRAFAAAERRHVLHNVVDVAARMTPPLGRELLWRISECPDAAVRAAAYRGLVHHAVPGDEARIRSLLPQTTVDEATVLLAALARVDAEGLASDLSQWIAAGELEPLWLPASDALLAAPQAGPTALRRAGEARTALEESERGTIRALLAGCAVRAGDEEALARLQAASDAEQNPYATARLRVIDVLARAGRGDALHVAARREPDPAGRVLALGAVAASSTEGPAARERRETLRAALSDEHPPARALALAALVRSGDAEGIDFALARLEGDPAALEEGIAALAPASREDATLADRAVDVLRARLERDAALPLTARAGALKALGSLNSAEAAEWLLERARNEGGSLASLPAHRWLALQAGNTFPRGAPVLRRALVEERDPLRRIDLLLPLSLDESAETTALLFEIASLAAAYSELEALFVATRLLRTRPADEVAPLLKRAALRMQDERPRRALECLLGRYFGV